MLSCHLLACRSQDWRVIDIYILASDKPLKASYCSIKLSHALCCCCLIPLNSVCNHGSNQSTMSRRMYLADSGWKISWDNCWEIFVVLQLAVQEKVIPFLRSFCRVLFIHVLAQSCDNRCILSFRVTVYMSVIQFATSSLTSYQLPKALTALPNISSHFHSERSLGWHIHLSDYSWKPSSHARVSFRLMEVQQMIFFKFVLVMNWTGLFLFNVIGCKEPAKAAAWKWLDYLVGTCTVLSLFPRNCQLIRKNSWLLRPV